MNILGKGLTVGIALAAVMLMAVSTMVYATHKNWKTEAESLKDKLAKVSAEKDRLETKSRSLESQLKAELEVRLQDVRKLETEREQLLAESAQIQKQLDNLLQEQRRNTAAVASTQANNEELTKEVNRLRGAVQENQQKRDEAFAAAVKATEELHDAQGKLSTLRERHEQLTQADAMKARVLRSNGLDPNALPNRVVPQVRGLVSKALRNAAGVSIEITIGEDDGLRKGDTVEIFRGERYLGRAKVIRTEPDRAVAQVIRKFQQGQIQENDHVATKLRVG